MLFRTILFYVLLIIPSISFPQNFQNFTVTSKSYGHISDKTNAWIWEADSIGNIGITFYYDTKTFRFFGSNDEFFTMTGYSVIENTLNSFVFAGKATDINGTNFSVQFSIFKYTSELNIIFKEKKAFKFKMINLQSY